MSKKVPDNQEEKITFSHPSQDSTNRFSLDNILRKHGFKIHSRRGDREAVWDLQGVLFLESEALLRLNRNEIKEAERHERSYWKKIDERAKNELEKCESRESESGKLDDQKHDEEHCEGV
jgi:hypothetical protein